MKRNVRKFVVVKKGGEAERAELKSLMLRELAFRAPITKEAVIAGLRKV